MKKRVLLILTLVLSVCLMIPFLVACGSSNPKADKNLVLSHDSIVVEVGKSEQLIAFYEGSTDSVNVTWESSDPTIASVDENGSVAGVLKGEAVITATDSKGKTATCNVTVVNNTLLYESSGSGYIITGFDGIKEEIVIPSTIGSTKVTEIADGAFKDNNTVKSITIPDTVTHIGMNAFENCVSLERLEVPVSVTIIGSEAFKNCTSLVTVVVLDGEGAGLSFETSAFAGCSNLTSITLSDRVKVIKDNAFASIPKLENVYFDYAKDVIIQSDIFAGSGVSGNGIKITVAGGKELPSGIITSSTESGEVPSVTELEFEDGLTSLQSNNYLPFLKKVVLPKTIVAIYPGLFNGCVNLVEVVLPQGLVEGYHFDCWYTNEECSSDKVDSIVLDIEDTTTVLYAKWSPNLNTLTFDGNGATDGVTESMQIHTDATQTLSSNGFTRTGYIFLGWSTTPDGEIEYDDGASYIMGTQSSYTLYAVWADASLNVVHFDGNGATSGKTQSMYMKEGDSKNLSKNGFVKDGYKFVGWSTSTDGEVIYEDCAPYTMGSNPTTTLYAKWEEVKYYVSYVIVGGQNSSENITEFTFSDLPIALKSAKMEDVEFDGWYTESSGNGTKVTEINECKNYTLYANWVGGTYGLQYQLNGSEYSVSKYTGSTQNVVIPAVYKDLPVTSINADVFKDKKTLFSITIPSTIKSIGANAFRNCFNLKHIAIPSSVTSIGNYAFNGCVSLQDLYIEDIVAWCNISFSNEYSNPMCHADKIYLNGNLTTRIVIPSTVETIKNRTFYLSTLKEVVISEGVKSIGSSAFNKSDIESITIPSSITNIGNSAFSNATYLKNVYIPSVENWLGITFGNYYSNPLHLRSSLYVDGKILEDLIIPDTITTINSYALYGCQSLKSIKISKSVSIIGSYAFSGCDNVERVTYEENSSLEQIKSYAFAYMNNLIRVDIPASVTSIGDSAFYNDAKAQIYIHGPKNISLGSYWSACSAYGSQYFPVAVIWDCENNKLDDSYSYEYGITIDGINYAIKDDHAKVVGTNISGDVVIPSSIVYNSITYPVTIIGSGAFSGNINLNSVVVPSSVTTIQDKAFRGCRSLTKVVIPSSVTKVGNALFVASSSVTLYLEAQSQPSGWSGYNIDWNTRLNINLVWDYKNNAPDLIVNDIVTIDGITYKLNGNNASVTGVTAVGNVVIPRTITHNSQIYTVSSISRFVLDEDKLVGSIFIPNTVTSISTYAFFSCIKLRIYCESTSSSGWTQNWNYDGGSPHPVYYYKEAAPEEDYSHYGYWRYVDEQIVIW
ncbi:MAG: hypothetical protein E7353_06215 [Clostridiales bacterium]|nr:hypothetical protein [Clostridiales bacterium]